MNRRDLIEQEYERLKGFEFDAVPEQGRGSANDFRVRKAVEGIGKWLELNPKPGPKEPPRAITGPVPGGWLARGRTEARPYWPVPLWGGLSRAERRRLLPEVAGVTVPYILISSKPFPGAPPAYDATKNLTSSVGRAMEITEGGGSLIVFGASDHDAKKLGWRQVMRGLISFTRAALDAGVVITAACPGIEMDEWSSPEQWREMEDMWRESGLDVPLAGHFKPEMYYRFGDLILWQDEDRGHDGSIRTPFVRKAYLLNNDTRPGGFMDDRTVGSPARSAKEHGIGFVYFEYGVPAEMSEELCEECRLAAMQALRLLDMPEWHG